MTSLVAAVSGVWMWTISVGSNAGLLSKVERVAVTTLMRCGLGALRKVEREHQRTRTPLLEKLLDPSAKPRMRLWPLLLVGALLVNTVVLAVLLVPRDLLGKLERLSPSDLLSSSPSTSRSQAGLQTAGWPPGPCGLEAVGHGSRRARV